MSLDIFFLDPTTLEPVNEDYKDLNITHNLNTIAQELGFYEILWRPEETINEFEDVNRITGKEILPKLYSAHYNFFNNQNNLNHLLPKNGWGDFNCFNRFITDYMYMCYKYPNHIISVSR